MTLAPPDRPLLLLWGFMGAGKSTVGRCVASRAKVEFLDLDQHIETQSGRRISQIFADEGEASFRRLEADALRAQLARKGRRVIALGGGTLLDHVLRAEAMERSYVLTLEVTIDQVLARTAQDSARPLLSGSDPREAAERLFAARSGAYRSVHDSLPTARSSEAAVASLVLERWRGSRS